MADVISTEARAKYHEAIRNDEHRRYQGLTFWSPNINIFRDPRWGRGMETYGEDPFLTGRMAVAFIKGLQGNDPHYFKVVATAKHYAVHSGPEPSRHVFDVKPDPRDLDDTYLPAFKAAIVEGKADSVMCAYNRVDGVPACASTDLLESGCAASGASRASSSATAAPSPTSTASTSTSRTPPKPARSRSRPAPISPAATSTAPSPTP